MGSERSPVHGYPLPLLTCSARSPIQQVRLRRLLLGGRGTGRFDCRCAAVAAGIAEGTGCCQKRPRLRRAKLL